MHALLGGGGGGGMDGYGHVFNLEHMTCICTRTWDWLLGM